MAVPKFDLAPKLEHPLSLWNPLDYLRLLYWIFFFPQALRWYVETHGHKKKDGGQYFFKAIRDDPIQRNLFIQVNLVILITPVVICLFLQELGFKVDWFGVVIGLLLGIVVGVTLGMLYGIAGGMAEEGVALGIAAGVVLGIAPYLSPRIMPSMTLGMALISAVIVILSVAGGVALSVIFGVIFGVVFGITESVTLGVIVGLTTFLTISRLFPDYLLILLQRVWNGLLIIEYGLLWILQWLLHAFLWILQLLLIWPLIVVYEIREKNSDGLRKNLIEKPIKYLVEKPREYLVEKLREYLEKIKGDSIIGRTTWIPLPRLERVLLEALREDPETGIHNINQTLAFSMQFIPVANAINRWVDELDAQSVLSIASASGLSPYDWELLRSASTLLRSEVWSIATDEIRFLPSQIRGSLKKRFDMPLRWDIPARALCTGYWAFYKKNNYAVEAFKKAHFFQNGENLYQSAKALFEMREVKDMSAIVNWAENSNWMEHLNKEPLRSREAQTLQRFRGIALEAAVASESVSKFSRTAALGRAVGALIELIIDIEYTHPYPEYPIVKEIAVQWRDMLSLASGQAGQIAITRPVANPFVVGNPVSGQVFVGREEIFKRLEGLWGADPKWQSPSIVLFGHRRMGKSSILQNLGRHRFGVHTLVAQFTMQRAPRLENTGQLLGYLALAIHDALQSGNISSPEPDIGDFKDGYLAFNNYLRRIKPLLNDKRVILTIDEFESIEGQISKRRLDPETLEFLRGVIHSEPWLILVLAGLHTLEEMSADYWNPLFASVTPIRVSFLSLEATGQLLANPTEDFPLDFTADTVQRVYEYVRGQPYLAQLIGHTLVRHYNREVFENQRPRSLQFTPQEVDEIITSSEFYEQGSYYFTGVWGQAEKGFPTGQLEILRALASSSTTMSDEDLSRASGLSTEKARTALETLIRHDVISRSEHGCDFTVPLMRRWINEHAPKS